jgi:serine/threonine protein kinase
MADGQGLAQRRTAEGGLALTPEIYQKAKALFEAGLSVSKGERAEWLSVNCSDPELREAVESLLNEHDNPIGFVDGPIEQGIGDLLANDSGPLDADRGLPKQIGRYKILRVVGRGGMGTVYEAQQESPRRRVALKVIRSSMLSPQLLRRFSLEAQVLGQLQHAGIAQIYEASIEERADDQVPYFAMEFIDGCPLTEFCSANHLSLAQHLELFARVCDAVQHAHQKGIIHRDLKPANIIVAESDGTDGGTGVATSQVIANAVGQPKIVDFGIARMLDSDQQAVTLETNAGELVGTLCYMSPEQVSGQTRDIDTRCDVYALGVILYELLAGRVPFSFRGLAITDAIRIVRDDEPSRLGLINPACRGDIETIVCKAMEKDRDRRYASSAELAADLRRFMRNEPIQARPATALYQLSKFARRNKALVGGVAATMVALILGLGGSLYFLRQARQRQAQLQTVADFQGRMLTEIDVEDMGRQILADIRADALDRSGNNEDTAVSPEFLDQYDQFVTRIDATGIASRLLDDQVISNAVATVESEFADQPMVDAELRMALGRVYNSLGLYEKARDQFDNVYARRVALLGPNHVDTLVALRDAGMMRAMLGDFAEAKSKVSDALEGLRRTLGGDDRITLQTLLNLGNVEQDMSEFEDAENTFQTALDGARRALGPNDPVTIDAMAFLGNHYRVAHNPEQAEPLLREALNASREALGENAPETIGHIHRLAIFLTFEQRYDEAEPFMLEAYKKRGEIFGNDHPDTLSSGHSLAELYIYEGKYDLAEPLLRDVLEKRRRAVGGEHPSVVRSLNTLSHLLLRTNRRAEAATILRESYAIAKRSMGKANNTTTVAALNLAVTYKELGQFTEAEQFAIAAYEGRRDSFGPDQYRTLSTRIVLGEIYLAAGRFDACAALFAAILEQVKKTEAEGTPVYTSVISRLAQARIAVGHAEDAEPLCRELLAFCQEHMKSKPAIIGLAQRLLATSLIPQRKFEEAERLLAESFAALKRQYAQDHWQVQYANALLCLARVRQGDEKSRRLLAESVRAVDAQQDQIPINERFLVLEQLHDYLSRQD